LILYHYTNATGLAGIIASQILRALTKARNPKDVRYGNGQYPSDIRPRTKTPTDLARIVLNLPFLKGRYTHFVAIDVTGLSVIQGRPGVYIILNDESLPLMGRIVESGENRPIQVN